MMLYLPERSSSLNEEVLCWRLPDACCTNGRQFPGSSKLEVCLICPIFKLNAEGDPRGWNHFLADEMGYLSHMGDKTTACREKTYLEILNNLPCGPGASRC